MFLFQIHIYIIFLLLKEVLYLNLSKFKCIILLYSLCNVTYIFALHQIAKDLHILLVESGAF